MTREEYAANRRSERKRSYYQAHREERRAYQKKYDAAHREERRAYNREYMRRYRSREKNTPPKDEETPAG